MNTLALTTFILLSLARVDVAPLKEDPILSQRAEIRAEQLCEGNQWSHEGWEEAYGQTDYRFHGENLAKGFNDLHAAHQALMQSPSHRENILNPNYQRFGIGYSEECDIVVQFYGGGFMF